MRKHTIGPDGGWGWMVCLGTFIVTFIVEGTTAAFGVIIIPIQNEFEASKSSTTWIASLSFGVCLLVGPIVGILLDKYSIRQTTLAGTIIGVLGFTISAFSPNIAVLIIAYGIFGGISMGMTFMCAVVAVGRYFERRRAIATGVAMSGAGFGMFTYPYAAEIMLHVYGWRGTVLIMAAIYFNCAISGTIFRPLPVIEDIHDTSHNRDDVKMTENISNGVLHKSPEFFSLLKIPNKNTEANKSSQSLDHFTKLRSGTLKLKRLSTEEVYLSLPHISSPLLQEDEHGDTIRTNENNEFLQNGSSLQDIHSSELMKTSREQIHTDTISNNSDTRRKDNRKCCSGDNVKLLKQPKFILALLAMLFWSVQYISTLYIPDFAMTHGIPGHLSALLVSIIGATNTLGRFISGFIVDFLHIRSITMYFLAFAVASVGTFFLPFCVTFWQIAMYSVVSGLCVGIFVGVRTIVLVDFAGIEYLAYGFGWSSFVQGLSSIPAPPIAGFLYDRSGSYKYTFMMVAVFYLCGSITCLILRLSHRWSRFSKS